MKKFIGLLLSFFKASSSSGLELHEASMNFDMENVRTFLERLNRNLKIEVDIGKLETFTSHIEHDDMQSVNLKVNFDGNAVNLEFRVFMDDIDSPDLYFFSTSKPLIKAIDKQLEEFAEELGL